MALSDSTLISNTVTTDTTLTPLASVDCPEDSVSIFNMTVVATPSDAGRCSVWRGDVIVRRSGSGPATLVETQRLGLLALTDDIGNVTVHTAGPAMLVSISGRPHTTIQWTISIHVLFTP